MMPFASVNAFKELLRGSILQNIPHYLRLHDAKLDTLKIFPEK